MATPLVVGKIAQKESLAKYGSIFNDIVASGVENVVTESSVATMDMEYFIAVSTEGSLLLLLLK